MMILLKKEDAFRKLVNVPWAKPQGMLAVKFGFDKLSPNEAWDGYEN